MVMQNRHDGANSHEWWEDLPPGVRKRFANPPPSVHRRTVEAARATPSAPTTDSGPGMVRDLSRVAGLFLAVAVANLLFLLLALAFLFAGTPAR